jgi:hypothetical protein
VSEPAWKTELRSDFDQNAWKIGGPYGDWDTEEAMKVATPHAEAAFKRGHEAGSSKAGYRLVQENERLRRELELAHQANQRRGVCPTCLSALDASGTTRASAGDPPEGAAP